jgi:Skp family chaperone for outer membrane proteins
MTKKLVFFVLSVLVGLNTFSQRGQRIGFVDMNYILENIPAYTRAQGQLDRKVISWQQDLDKIKNEIALMQTDLSNEKALLTADLIEDKEEDIVIKQLELKKTEEDYFSSNGSLFLLRKQLVTPIQDQVYNASQEIAKARKYDFIFDKSSDLIMLYSNKANDISELVLRSIVKGEKISAANLKREEINKPRVKRNAANPAVINSSRPTENSAIDLLNADEDPEISVADEREAKRAAALAKIEQQKLDRVKKRDAQKAAIEKKRQERLKQQEEIRNQLKNNQVKKEEDKKEDSKKKEDDQEENNN